MRRQTGNRIKYGKFFDRGKPRVIEDLTNLLEEIVSELNFEDE